MDERSQELTTVVDALLKVHDDWAQDPEKRYLTAEYEEAIEDTLAVFEDGDLPADCRRLDNAVEWLRKKWAEYKEEEAAAGNAVQQPTNAFWRAIEQVRESRKAARSHRRAHLESIATLTAQKVSDNQICRMYGFVDGHGQPDLVRLQEERAEPGRHTNPDNGWEPPAEARRRDREQQQTAAVARSKKRLAEKMAARGARKPTESIAELLEQGVAANQICKMHGCSLDDVRIEADRLGIDFAENYGDAMNARGAYDPPLTDEQERHMDGGRTPALSARTDALSALSAPPATAKKRGRPRKEAPPADPDAIVSGQTPDEYIADLARRGVGEDSILAACQADKLRVSKSQIKRIVQQVADAAEAATAG